MMTVNWRRGGAKIRLVEETIQSQITIKLKETLKRQIVRTSNGEH